MNYRGLIVLCVFCSLLLALSGCKQSSLSQEGGFVVLTAERTQAANGALSPPRPIPGGTISGVFTGTIGNETPIGTVSSYSAFEGATNTSGKDDGCDEPVEYQQSSNYYWVCYGEAPAYWTIDYQVSFDCGNTNTCI